ncbi:hypothetical protein IC230_11595 [Spirosoma sp. BT704]|uniref:Phosphatase PAP2 family protein n=2 Tax=Spirosoma validum TaxID=2771355 RepID=A0A927B1I7_9BACT|nr:hypothetical protein [Spirosoma validum]
MPTLLFAVLLFLAPSALNLDMFGDSLRLSLLVLIFVGTFMVPAVLTYYLLRIGYVQDMQLTNLSDRRLPYFMTALIYLLVAYLFSFQMRAVSSLAPEIGILIGSIAVSILLGGVISLSWQISAHGIGIGGVIGVIAGLIARFDVSDLFIPLLVLVFLTGLVASARLKLNAHTPAQIGAGLALGFVTGLLTVYWFFI